MALAVLYDLRAYRNFSTPEAMDTAQLARNIADGKGYTTSFIRPLSLYLVQRNTEARQAGAPVRLTLTRPEEQMDSGNRPSVRQRIRVGANRDGTLTAMAITWPQPPERHAGARLQPRVNDHQHEGADDLDQSQRGRHR